MDGGTRAQRFELWPIETGRHLPDVQILAVDAMGRQLWTHRVEAGSESTLYAVLMHVVTCIRRYWVSDS